MLALTTYGDRGIGRASGALGFVQDFGTITISILGVPFAVTKLGITPTKITGYQIKQTTATVSKSKVPAALAKEIDKRLAAEVKRLVTDSFIGRTLARNPAKLLDQAKRTLGLIGENKVTRYIREKFGATAASKVCAKHLVVAKIATLGGVEVTGKHWLVDVEDLGSSYRVKLCMVSNPSELEQVAGAIAWPIEQVVKVGAKVVDLAKDGIEALVKALEAAFKMLCQLAQSKLGDLAQEAAVAYATGGTAYVQGQVSSMAVKYGAEYGVTSSDAQKAAALAQQYGGSAGAVKAVTGVLSEKICGGKAAAPSAAAPSPEAPVPWYKRPMTYVIAGGIAAAGIGVTWAIRK